MNKKHQKNKPGYLLLTELFAPTRGGSAVWFEKVYSYMGNKSTHLITAQVPGSEDYDDKCPLSVHRLKFQRHWYYRPESLGMYIKLFFSSLKLASRNKFHSIHAGRVLPEGLTAFLVARLIKRPFLVYAHGEEITTWNQPLKRRFLAYVYRKADAVIVNSEFTRDLILNLDVRKEKVHLINPGADLRVFCPGLDSGELVKKNHLEGKRVILSVGRLSRRKGFDNVIKAIPFILTKNSDAHYVIVGTGEDRTYLQDLAVEYAVQDHVTFAGNVSEDELPLWYNLCDIFVMPNRKVGEDNEGFGMVFIEANACGKPVIAGIDGGTSSSVIHGVTGLRVNATDVGEIANGILNLLNDNRFAEMLGKAGLKRARESFGWDRVAKKTLDLLQIKL